MAERLDVRQARGGSIGGALPKVQRAIRHFRFCIVVSQEFRLPLHNVGKMGCELIGDALVQLPPSRLQYGLERRVSDQRVFEDIA